MGRVWWDFLGYADWIGESDERFDVGECATGKFFNMMLFTDKLNNFKWNLINIYGASHEKDKADFLAELVQVY
jgi:hypothetical protein